MNAILMKDWFTAIRAYQWIKNGLLFVPLIMAHEILDRQLLLKTIIAFVAFSACASAMYVMNDLLDLEADRNHPQKRLRPLASGRMSLATGRTLVPILLMLGMVLSSFFLGKSFTVLLVGYIVLVTAYSTFLKEQTMIDVLLVAGFYAYRVVAGAVAAEVNLSPWFLAFSMFFFLSLAFVKRYAELSSIGETTQGHPKRRPYTVKDLDLLRAIGPTSGYLSVLVLALYINLSFEVKALYNQPKLLWAICPLLLYWISRVWFEAHRGRMRHDPILFAVRDPMSYVVAMLIAGLAAMAGIGVPFKLGIGLTG